MRVTTAFKRLLALDAVHVTAVEFARHRRRAARPVVRMGPTQPTRPVRQARPHHPPAPRTHHQRPPPRADQRPRRRAQQPGPAHRAPRLRVPLRRRRPRSRHALLQTRRLKLPHEKTAALPGDKTFPPKKRLAAVGSFRFARHDPPPSISYERDDRSTRGQDHRRRPRDPELDRPARRRRSHIGGASERGVGTE